VTEPVEVDERRLPAGQQHLSGAEAAVGGGGGIGWAAGGPFDELDEERLD
jgi:hypothetical protein